MVAKYDTKNLMPLLVVVFQFLNPNVNGTIEPTTGANGITQAAPACFWEWS
jgi:hypothetical protein